MARIKKTIEVKKFGGVDDLGAIRDERNVNFKSELSGTSTEIDNVNYDVKSLEVQSKTNLEMDEGYGDAAIIRRFEFGMNPLAFQQMRPTKQELFNSHHKGIEVALWKDGMKVMPDVNPRVVVDEVNKRYSIFVGAKPMKGHILHEQPQTLSQIVHG